MNESYKIISVWVVHGEDMLNKPRRYFFEKIHKFG